MDAFQPELERAARRSRVAARTLANADRALKDRALYAIADRIVADAASVLAANREDVDAARVAGIDEAMLDRLTLSEARLQTIAEAVRQIASFDDPVGEIVGMKRRPNGLLVGQVRIPLGVIAMIYEARPNVTVDAAALCLKSGNAVLLRGGKEAARSNAALGASVRAAVASVGLPLDSVQVIAPQGREEIKALVGLVGLIDLVIPRGGEGLIRFVTEHARVPVIQHYKGVCHLYVDEGADVAMALQLVKNGKLQRPGVCNALECVLVHEAAAPAFFSAIATLGDALEVRGDAAVRALLPGAAVATDEDWGREYLAPILAARVVGSLDQALDHIETYGSNHTEVICTRSYPNGQRFLREVDASMVLINASSRFNDGGELGLGAEIGISTTKLHAYGPMGLGSLTALKWVGYGDGQTRA